MIDLLLILGLSLTVIFLCGRIDVLEQENTNLRGTIKRDKKWYEFEKDWFETEKVYIRESAILSERLRASNEEFQKNCKEFIESVEKVK